MVEDGELRYSVERKGGFLSTRCRTTEGNFIISDRGGSKGEFGSLSYVQIYNCRVLLSLSLLPEILPL